MVHLERADFTQAGQRQTSHRLPVCSLEPRQRLCSRLPFALDWDMVLSLDVVYELFVALRQQTRPSFIVFEPKLFPANWPVTISKLNN